MNFKEFDKIFKEHKFDMLFMEIYYNLRCYLGVKLLNGLTEEEKTEIIYLIHDAYLKDEQHIDLAFISDTAAKNIESILDGNWTKYDLLDECYNRM